MNTEQEAYLESLASTALPIAKESSRTTNDDGSVDESGVLSDGRRTYRHFDPEGKLRRDGWYHPETGESANRSYYRSGQVQSVFWRRTNDNISNMNFDESGRTAGRYDNVDDTGYFYGYDDLGRLIYIHVTRQNGESRTLWERPR